MDLLKKENVIEFYYKSGILHDECSKVCDDKDLLNDLIQDLALILLEKEESELVNLHANGCLLFFIRKIIKNQYCSQTSPFFTRFKKFRLLSSDIDIANV